MKFKTLLFALLVFWVTVGAHAQTATGNIRGVIADNEGTVPGASVYVESLLLGTVTDLQGKFFIANVPAGAQKIKISYVGYTTIEKQVNVVAGQTLDLGKLALNAGGQQLAEIVVRGSMTNSEARAINIQKISPRIVSVIAADGIGKLPDRNAGEAVQRISGVSIERDQGEGRFVAVRGLPSQWSSSTINGDRIPTAEEETTSRATAFDFFPSDMIQFVEVSKAITPDMEGDAIGGNVNFITRTAPESKTFNISLGGGYNQKAEKPIFSANVLFGNRSKDKKFGYLINGTVWNRSWATDNFEPRRGNDGLGIRRLELRDYVGQRNTYGINAAAEYNLTDDSKIYIKALYGTLRDNETHYKHRLRFDKDRVELQNIHNLLITRMQGGELGGQHQLNNTTKLDWKVASYDNVFYYGDNPNGQDNGYYVVRFDQKNVGFTGLEDRGTGKNYAYNTIDGGTDVWNKTSTHLPAGFRLDPTQMNLAWVEVYKVHVNERDNIIAQLNLTTDVNTRLKLKFGTKYRNKERTAYFSDEFYAWNPAAGNVPALSSFNTVSQPGAANYLSELGNGYHHVFAPVVPVNDLNTFWNNNKQNLTLDKNESALLENGGALGRNFYVVEQHISGYAMATYQLNPKTSVIGGLRATQTLLHVKGNTYDKDRNQLNESIFDNNYLALLPMLHFKYSPDDLMNIRLAATRTFSRPDFGALTPGGTFVEVDNTFTSGNPLLKPTFSWNFDAMVEKFFGNVGFVSLGGFYKIISDPIFQTSTVGTYNGRDGVNLLRPENGSQAWLRGIEFGINRRFDFLPGFLSGLGINANYTYMQSEMSIPERNDKVRIPRQANHLYNVALFYEKGNFNARLAMNHKGGYIQEHGKSATFDSYYGDYTSMDFTASYRLNNKVMIYAEMNNLLNEPMIYYLGDANRPLQVEYYGVRGQMGVKINLF